MNITNVGTPNIKENKNDRLHLKSEMEGNAQKNSLFVTCKLQAQMELLRHFHFQEVVTLTMGILSQFDNSPPSSSNECVLTLKKNPDESPKLQVTLGDGSGEEN